MKITELLPEGNILLGLSAGSKEEVWQKMVEKLCADGAVRDGAAFLRDVAAREAQGTTGVGFGVAIPHAKSAAVAKPALAMAQLKGGIDVASLDGTQADLFFLIAAPVQGENIHLQALSKLARMLMHESFLEALRSAQTADDVLAAIGERDQ